jgi:succinoglycan biosynthesis transport protein ExoP
MARAIDELNEADEDVSLDLRSILLAVWRRRIAVVLVTALAGVGTFLALSMVTPRFQAETKILIENREPLLSRDSTAPSDRSVVDQESVASQVQLLTSRDLARRVAEKHKLGDREEFDGTEAGLVETLLMSAGIGRDRLRVSPEERVVDAFMEHLNVYRVDGSRVITILFTASDRELAAAVANSITEEYVALQGEAKRRTSEDQTRWLGEEIEKLRVKVREGEAAIEKYRSGNDLFLGSNNASLARQQLTDLTNAIATARSDKAAAESKAGQLKALLQRRGDLETATDVLDTDTFRSLRAREIALRSKLSELSVTLLGGHPQIKMLQSQIDDIEAQEVAEARRVLASLQNDADVAAARIVSLQDSLNQLKVTSAEDGSAEVELRALEREAGSQRALLESLLTRYREAVARQNAEVLPADARVISRAATPVEPTFPKVVPLTVVATLAGFLLSVVWVISGEFLSGRALTRVPLDLARPHVVPAAAGRRSDEDDEPVETVAGPAADESVPEPGIEDAAPGAVDPRVARFRARIGAAAAAVRETEQARQALPVAELDGLHALLIADGASRVAVMGVGSASGVERVIAGMSRQATVEGTRVVVVDTVPARAGIGGAGLSDLIAGEAAFAEIIRRNPATRAHEIGVGREPIDAELWGGAEIETMLDALEHTYDLVLLDLGPMEADAGRFRLVASADHAILVGDLNDPDVVRAARILARNGVNKLAVVPVPGSVAVDAVA